jgi:hypothetical protein
MKITTEFTVASVRGMDILRMLTRQLAIEKFSSLLQQPEIDAYLLNHCNEKTLLNEVNSMSNQWIVAYADNLPVGYATITSKGRKPSVLDQKRAIRIANAGVLHQWSDPAIINALLEKCLTVCKSYQGIWISEYIGNPLIKNFEDKGFVKQKGDWQMDELSLPSVCLVR